MEDQAQELRELMSGHKTKIIAVTSGKGGVGKTNIAVNMAIGYAQQGKKVILIDGDLGLANINVLLNAVPQYNLMQVINKQKTMQEIITETEYGFKFIAGANGFSKIANLSVDELDDFAEQFSQLSDADIIIVDTGAGIANNVLQFVAAADEVCVVTTPEPTAITDAYGMIKIITTEYVDREMSIKLLVNRVHSDAEGKRVSERIVSIVSQFLNYKVEYVGFIYEDPVVQASVSRQKPFMSINPNSKPAQCVKNIIAKLDKKEVGNADGVSSFLKKFLRRN
jgi:flagellar biosynthesis protein FlhG